MIVFAFYLADELWLSLRYDKGNSAIQWRKYDSPPPQMALDEQNIHTGKK